MLKAKFIQSMLTFFAFDTDENDAEVSGYEDHDEYTRLILKVEFPPFYFSTHGLSRPSTPKEEDQQR